VALSARLDALNPGAARLVATGGRLDARALLDSGRFVPGRGAGAGAVGRWLNEAAYARVAPARACCG